jgi:hypothetical protein
MSDWNWPFSDARVPCLNVHCAHIANIRRADRTVRNAVLSDVHQAGMRSAPHVAASKPELKRCVTLVCAS